MKLHVKQKYFRQLKQGTKTKDYRSAHATFVNEGETGGKVVRKVVGVSLIDYSELPKDLQESMLFDEDEKVICFELEPEEKAVKGDKLNQDLLL
jgi:hypothetical protein